MDFNGSPSHLNSNGERNKDTADKRAAWANVSRQFGDKTYGIVVYDHPSNSGHPAMWRADGQGLINPSPSLQGDWSIEPNRDGLISLCRCRRENWRGQEHSAAS